MKSITMATALLACSLAAACVARQPVAGPGAGAGAEKGRMLQQLDLDAAVRLARADAARLTGLAPEALQLISAERVIWPDGSIGCPKPGMAYTQALVPGFRVRLRGPAGELDYHASERGSGVVLCPAKLATDPVPGGHDSRI